MTALFCFKKIIIFDQSQQTQLTHGTNQNLKPVPCMKKKCNQSQERENMKPVTSAGEILTVAKSEETCSRCQARENMELVLIAGKRMYIQCYWPGPTGVELRELLLSVVLILGAFHGKHVFLLPTKQFCRTQNKQVFVRKSKKQLQIKVNFTCHLSPRWVLKLHSQPHSSQRLAMFTTVC